MCGRYTLSAGHEALARAFLAEFAEEIRTSWKPRYNIAPGTGILAIMDDRDRGVRRAEMFHWGLVPHWARDPDLGRKLINARAETVAGKPAYREAFRYRRCLVPASGFYEWDRARTPRQPYYFHPGSEPFMALAGIWEHWMHPGGSEILSAALITMPAHHPVETLHHRMPMVLPATAWDEWLNADLENSRMEPFLAASGSMGPLVMQAVSTAVNRTDRDDPGLIEPVNAPSTEDGGQLELF